MNKYMILIYFLIDPRDGSVCYHRPETIELMRSAHVGKTWTTEQIEKRAAKKRKPFICVETGQVFQGMGDAVTHFRCNKRYILESLKGRDPGLKFRWGRSSRNNIAGLTFRYVERDLP